MKKSLLAACVVAVFAMSTVVQAQAPAPIKRTPLQKVDVPGSTTMEVITGIAEIMPNVNIGRHTHAGAETGYLLEGQMTLLVEGKPPLEVKAGESYQVPLNAVHDARSGQVGAKVLAVYIVEKGKPLATPAP